MILAYLIRQCFDIWKILLQGELGQWNFKSKTRDTDYEGYMFPLHVQQQLDSWPEKHLRRRIWVCKKSAFKRECSAKY